MPGTPLEREVPCELGLPQAQLPSAPGHRLCVYQANNLVCKTEFLPCRAAQPPALALIETPGSPRAEPS